MFTILTADRVGRGIRSLFTPSGQGDCDCDCDCTCSDAPVGAAPTGAAPTPAARLVRNPALRRLPLDADYQAAFIPSGDHVAVLDESTLELIEAFAHPLARSELPADWRGAARGARSEALDSAVDELARLRFLIPPEAPALLPPVPGRTRLLGAWLHVTNACNLACRYCYLHKTSEAMCSEVGHAAIEAILRSAVIHGFSKVKLKYAGGEPTLNFALVIALHQHAARSAQAHGLAVEGKVLSNGVGLTQPMLDVMLANGLGLMISLDGIGPAHDSQRVFPNGAGSFQAVSRTVERALANGLSPDLSVTVTGRTIGGLAEVVTWALDRKLGFSINFCRENDASASCVDLSLDEARLVDGLQAAFQAIETNLPQRNLLASLVDRANLAAPHARTCSAGSNYLVIDPQGNIAKCQMQIGQSITHVNAPDPLGAVLSDPAGIQNLPVDEKEGCRECEWRYWCAGGCPLVTHRAAGRYDVRSPHCHVYQHLFPAVLRLEGLRLQRLAARGALLRN